MRALRAHGPIDALGVTGPALEAEGVERLAASADLAVVGFTGVLARLPRILAVRRRVLEAARSRKPDLAILVDSPGFNFRIGPALARRGIPVFYYIGPQVWAWHPERARAMSAWVSRLGVVFPFEEPLFRAAGVDAHFVGHPLLEDLVPEMDAAVVAVAPGLEPLVASRRFARDRDAGPVRALSGATHAIQAHAECCAVASGTATLETALFGTPLVIVYRTSRVNYAIARRVVKLEKIGLPNIVAEDEVAPELIQDRFTARAVAELLGRWLDDPAARAAARERLARVRERLGGPGAAVQAAARAWELLE